MRIIQTICNYFVVVFPIFSFAQSPTVNDTRNFTKVWEACAPQKDTGVVMQSPVRQVRQSATYFDGLGRPLQSVVKQGSLVTSTNSSKDLVSLVVYNQWGRAAEKYTQTYFKSRSGGCEGSMDFL